MFSNSEQRRADGPQMINLMQIEAHHMQRSCDGVDELKPSILEAEPLKNARQRAPRGHQAILSGRC
jgi:hypothetical protein